jgi:molybdopterin-guanine dinucleotide biosynthesis protein A
MKQDVAIVILAGGEGRRIGGDKPLLELAGERLIDRALRNASRWSTVVAVAVRDPAQVEPVAAPVIVDQDDIAGPVAGLLSALRFGAELDCRHVLTIAADMPFLPADLLIRLRMEIADLGCAMASSDGHVHPVCGLWRASAVDRADEYLASRRRSLRGFAELVGYVPVDWLAEPLDPFFNINTAEDLAAAECRAAN